MTSRCGIDKNGINRWYNSDGQLHREDGPAVEMNNGNKAWYINGKLHREDGPAVEYANGDQFWFINCIKYTYSDWGTVIRKIKLASHGVTIMTSECEIDNNGIKR